MKANIKLITCFIIIVLSLLLSANMVSQAADATITVDTEVRYNISNVPSGTTFKIKGLTKEEGVSYQYALLPTNTAPTDSDWKDIYSTNYEADGTVSISLTNGSTESTKYLRDYDSMYLSIKSKKSSVETTLLDKQKVELPLPDILDSRASIANPFAPVNIKITPIFDITKGQYQTVRITNENIIELCKNYLDTTVTEAKHNEYKQALMKLIPSEKDAPTSGWTAFTKDDTFDLPKLNSGETEGYFYVWTKSQQSATSRIITGINIIKITSSANNNGNQNTNTNTTNTANTSNTNVSNNSIISNTSKKDNTVANKILPKTGINVKFIVLGTLILIIGGIVFFNRYKHWHNI